MFTLDLLPKIQLEQINNDSGRLYKTPDGNLYPSITSILSGSKNEGLIAWRNAVGEDEANAISKRAANRGTKIHALAEDYLSNREVVYPNFLLKDQFIRFKKQLNRLNNIRALEYRLYCDQYRIAGTVDCIAEYDGVLSIIDFKTSNSPKYESMIDNYFTQAYAYRTMAVERYGIDIPNLVILISVDHDYPQVFQSNDFDKWNDKLLKAILDDRNKNV